MTHEESSFQTKVLLSSALKELMCHKQFSQISVAEIVRKSNVNRKTFYYHFSDIYDLLKWTLDQEAINALKEYNYQKDYDTALQFIIDYVMDNAPFLNSVYDSVGHEVIQRLFSPDFQILGARIIESAEAEAEIKLPEDFRMFLSDIYIESTVAIIVNGIRNPEKYSREKLIEYCKLSIPPLLPAAINAYKQSLK